MLSNAEQRQLTQIESRLRADDPQFVERFEGGWEPRRRGGWRRRVALAVVSLAVVNVWVGLVFANVATVVVAVLAIGAAGLWLTGRGDDTGTDADPGGAL